MNFVPEARIFTNELNGFLMSKYGWKTEPARLDPFVAGDTRIHVSRAPVTLMLRYLESFKYGLTLTVASIRFTPERNGCGAEFLTFLLNSGKSKSYTHVLFEQCTSAGASFCAKYGFHEYEKKQWLIDLQSLDRSLANQTRYSPEETLRHMDRHVPGDGK